MSDAQEAEATAGLISVEFRGDTYEVDPTRMTWDTLKADEVGRFSTVVEELLGPEEFARFTTSNPKPLVRDDDGGYVSIAALMRGEIITALGNSAASSGS